jgi:hypothetical protein
MIPSILSTIVWFLMVMYIGSLTEQVQGCRKKALRIHVKPSEEHVEVYHLKPDSQQTDSMNKTTYIRLSNIGDYTYRLSPLIRKGSVTTFYDTLGNTIHISYDKDSDTILLSDFIKWNASGMFMFCKTIGT